MNYSFLFKGFKKELAEMLQYNQLEKSYKILAFIATAPFWLLLFFAICAKYVYLFLFNCFASSCDYLECWVKETRKDVKHATEAVIYFISMPFIFFLRCILSVFSVFFYFLWFISMCLGYIASLGGLRWQPFITTASFKNEKCKVTTSVSVANIVVLIGFVLFALYLLLVLLSSVTDNRELSEFANIMDIIYTFYMIIAVPVAFKKRVVSAEGDMANANENAECEEECNESAEEETEEFEEEFPEI